MTLDIMSPCGEELHAFVNPSPLSLALPSSPGHREPLVIFLWPARVLNFQNP